MYSLLIAVQLILILKTLIDLYQYLESRKFLRRLHIPVYV